MSDCYLFLADCPPHARAQPKSSNRGSTLSALSSHITLTDHLAQCYPPSLEEHSTNLVPRNIPCPHPCANESLYAATAKIFKFKSVEELGVVPTDAATTGSGSSWFAFKARNRSAVACRERDQIRRSRGKWSVNSVNLLIRLLT